MTGLIWYVQVVHYPLLAKIPPNLMIAEYAAAYANRTGLVVIIPMLTELATAILLCMYPTPQMDSSLRYLSAALVIIIFLSTFLIQVPDHEQIQLTASPQAIEHLVSWNWIRTIAWSLRSVLLFICLL
jgi:hypothetical protein